MWKDAGPLVDLTTKGFLISTYVLLRNKKVISEILRGI